MALTTSPESRKAMTAVGVSAACLGYALSLPLQRITPAIRDILGITLAGGIHPTYYLRAGASLALGLAAAALTPRGPVVERRAALATALAIALSVLLVCAFP